MDVKIVHAEDGIQNLQLNNKYATLVTIVNIKIQHAKICIKLESRRSLGKQIKSKKINLQQKRYVSLVNNANTKLHVKNNTLNQN